MKAPEFENVPGFDKSNNTLWEVKTRVSNSLVFVNFDAREQVPEFDLGTHKTAFDTWNMKNMRCAADWKAEGKFNWKLAGR